MVTIIEDGIEPPLILDMVRPPCIIHKYIMPEDMIEQIMKLPFEFGYEGFSEFIYYRTYSQRKNDGKRETFPETIVRVIQGIISIQKDYMIKFCLHWNEQYWNDIAFRMAISMMKIHFLPPGRGLWISGTEYSYTRGSSAFNNCGFISTGEGLIKSACWTMDMLMCGCGIGFDTKIKQEELDRMVIPTKFNGSKLYRIHDSREGWVKSVMLLLESYFDGVYIDFDYSLIRKEGEFIRGFGGTSSGPEPLRILHERIRLYTNCYINCKTMPVFDIIMQMQVEHLDLFKFNSPENRGIIYEIECLNKMPQEIRDSKTYGKSRYVADIFNSIGICVVVGNVRRSSQIAMGDVTDTEFSNLKNHKINPERMQISWMSNNTVCFNKTEDFENLPLIASRICDNGEPGCFNQLNVSRFGRIGVRHPIGREAEEDKAIGLNPCAEILLESGELCNLAELFPSRCTEEELEEATYLATIYATTVSLLPTHWTNTNAIIARNHRIGISMTGIVNQVDKTSVMAFTKLCKRMYKLVRKTNADLSDKCGVPRAIRCTTVKPSGTISLLAGEPSGVHRNLFNYCIRRVRVGATTELADVLKKSGYDYEEDVKAGGSTLVFSFPLKLTDARIAKEVSVWEQACMLELMQRIWADNSVSCTLYFTKAERHQVEHVLSHFIPLIKSVSMLPHTEDTVIYEQAPFEEITEQKYLEMLQKINSKEEDYSNLTSTPVGVRGCDGDRCEL